MAIIEQLRNGDGSTLTGFTFTFPSYKVEDIKVAWFANNTWTDKTVTTHYTIVNYTAAGGGEVQFTSGNAPPSATGNVRIYRDTEVDTVKAAYQAGSSITADDLNNNFQAGLYALQELKQENIDTDRLMDGAVTTAKIDPDAITGAKIADDQINSEHYVDGSIDHVHLANDVIDGDNIQDDVINSEHIAAGAVDLEHMSANSVDSDQYVDGSIDSAHLADDAVITAKIATGAVTSDSIGTGAVTGNGLQASAVSTTKIADNAVQTAKINGLAVTTAKIDNDAVDGTKIADNAINTEHITAGAITNNKMANNSVASGNIVNGTIATTDIADDAITNAKIASDAVTSDSIGTGAVTGDGIQADAVDSTKIADNAIASEHIADAAIQNDHIAAATIQGGKIATGAISATQLGANSVTVAKIDDAELTTLAGMQSGTASVLADSTALTATTAELNLLDGKSIVTTIGASPTDVQIPTAQAVDERITTVVTDVGGFLPIANETSFPATNPDPADNAGTIVSIKALASNLTSNGSGVATIANGAGSGNTVTINGMANSDTIEAGKGILVETTSTLHTYTFHRETLAPADITNAQTAVNDFNERYRVNAGEPSSSLNEGDLVYDTNADKMKVYDSTTSAWKEVTSTGDFKYLFLCPAGGSGAPTINGSIGTYDLREGSNSGSAASVTNAAQLLVSINGVVQKANTGTSAPAEGFALVDANTIIFSANLPTGSSVFIHQAGSAVSIPTPGDDTVSTVKIQNLAVTTGKIADQAVALTKLPHGDGSSNGKFLRSNNGADPTWETVSTTPEGTAILSTGESGGTKFLREDGDNTCSWQEVIGAVADGCIYENSQTISNNYTIASGKGAHSVGPITVNATVTVNGNWVVS